MSLHKVRLESNSTGSFFSPLTVSSPFPFDCCFRQIVDLGRVKKKKNDANSRKGEIKKMQCFFVFFEGKKKG